MAFHTKPAAWCLAVVLAGCAGQVVPRSPEPASREALLVLPGFGYSNGAEGRFRALGTSLAAEGIDLYVPDYVERSGIADSRRELLEFYRKRGLDQYRRVHVFAFIAGAWTLNPAVRDEQFRNLATIVYDRSPLQERAPRIADEKLHFLTWVRYGNVVFDVARTPYVPVDPSGVRIGLMVETRPTSLIRKYAKEARSYGPFRFECDAFGQRHDDCIYLDMNHDDLYKRFAELTPQLLSFMRTGRFTAEASRVPPATDPLSRP